MMTDDDAGDGGGDEIDISSVYSNHTSTSPLPTTAMLAATAGNMAFLNNEKNTFSIGSLFRGGATTTNTPVVGDSGYHSNSIQGILMILSKLFQTVFVQNFCHFANFVGTTKTRCFCLLVFSVFVESYATTLSKQAKDTGNALLFARACLVYLFWYVFSFHFQYHLGTVLSPLCLSLTTVFISF